MSQEKKKHLIPITEGETVALIYKGITIEADFGTGGMALTWVEGEPMPAAVREIGLMRGVLNENTDGAGI